MNDDTTILSFVAPAPLAITESTEETEVEALLADIDDRVSGLRRLVASRGDDSARAALLEELGRLVADAQQFAAHLAEVELAAKDAVKDAPFAGWLTAPGGDQR